MTGSITVGEIDKHLINPTNSPVATPAIVHLKDNLFLLTYWMANETHLALIDTDDSAKAQVHRLPGKIQGKQVSILDVTKPGDSSVRKQLLFVYLVQSSTCSNGLAPALTRVDVDLKTTKVDVRTDPKPTLCAAVATCVKDNVAWWSGWTPQGSLRLYFTETIVPDFTVGVLSVDDCGPQVNAITIPTPEIAAACTSLGLTIKPRTTAIYLPQLKLTVAVGVARSPAGRQFMFIYQFDPITMHIINITDFFTIDGALNPDPCGLVSVSHFTNEVETYALIITYSDERNNICVATLPYDTWHGMFHERPFNTLTTQDLHSSRRSSIPRGVQLPIVDSSSGHLNTALIALPAMGSSTSSVGSNTSSITLPYMSSTTSASSETSTAPEDQARIGASDPITHIPPATLSSSPATQTLPQESLNTHTTTYTPHSNQRPLSPHSPPPPWVQPLHPPAIHKPSVSPIPEDDVEDEIQLSAAPGRPHPLSSPRTAWATQSPPPTALGGLSTNLATTDQAQSNAPIPSVSSSKYQPSGADVSTLPSPRLDSKVPAALKRTDSNASLTSIASSIQPASDSRPVSTKQPGSNQLPHYPHLTRPTVGPSNILVASQDILDRRRQTHPSNIRCTSIKTPADAFEKVDIETRNRIIGEIFADAVPPVKVKGAMKDGQLTMTSSHATLDSFSNEEVAKMSKIVEQIFDSRQTSNINTFRYMALLIILLRTNADFWNDVVADPTAVLKKLIAIDPLRVVKAYDLSERSFEAQLASLSAHVMDGLCSSDKPVKTNYTFSDQPPKPSGDPAHPPKQRINNLVTFD